MTPARKKSDDVKRPTGSGARKGAEKKKRGSLFGGRRETAKRKPGAEDNRKKVSTTETSGRSEQSGDNLTVHPMFARKFDADIFRGNEGTVLPVEGRRFREENLPEMPSKYNDDRIVLMARDPWWAHTYWDISDGRKDSVFNKISPDMRPSARWILRVYDVTGSEKDSFSWKKFFDLDIHFEASSWYINVNEPGRAWCVEIGFKTSDGTFYPVARSNFSKTPAFGLSDVIDERWLVSDKEYARMLDLYKEGMSSFELSEMLKKAISSFPSSGSFSQGVSSVTSGMKRDKKRKFFLEVWTELILYGRTEPDAEVTVCGKKTELRKDGTFTVRYALPEGDFEYPVVAVSSDKVDTEKRTPAVKRFRKR